MQYFSFCLPCFQQTWKVPLKNKKVNEVKLVEIINKNPQIFLVISHVQNEVLPLYKPLDHA